MIQIKKKSNKKLLEFFTCDPQWDIMIQSEKTVYKLVICFLRMESEFFSELPNDVKEVDLTHLAEPYLGQVLRAFYGD